MKNISALCLFLAYIGTIKCCWSSRCMGGQEYNSCGSFCTPTCDDREPSCIDGCLPRCECPSGQLWHERECITEDKCPPSCPDGQIRTECGSDREKTCLDPIPTYNEGCVKRCECPFGQVLDEQERCVPITECANIPCPATQEFHTCGSACNATCDDPFPVCIRPCVARCECPYGQVIKNDSGLCVPLVECFDIPQVDVCPDGQEFNECGSACSATCDDLEPDCMEQCVPRCECPTGHVFNARLQCVPRADCPAPCGPDAEPLTDSTGDELFCGLGPDRQDCPVGSLCTIHPLGQYAVCCPIN